MLTVNWNDYHYYRKISKGPGSACVRRRGRLCHGTMANPSLRKRAGENDKMRIYHVIKIDQRRPARPAPHSVTFALNQQMKYVHQLWWRHQNEEADETVREIFEILKQSKKTLSFIHMLHRCRLKIICNQTTACCYVMKHFTVLLLLLVYYLFIIIFFFFFLYHHRWWYKDDQTL